MHNVLRVLGRDVLRLLKTPAALVVVLALLVLPSIYTWYNVIGFWDPYGNTGNLRVAVVNEDAGGQSDLTGPLDVGAQIVDELRDNTQLAWYFTDRDTAMDDLEAGRTYAAFVIPEDFTADLLTLSTGDFTQPDIEYYVNEKLGPVSPKITDSGATTLEETVNSAFVSTVSSAVVDTLDKASASGQATVDASRSRASAKVDAAVQSVQGVRDTLTQAASSTDDVKAKTAEVRCALTEARSQVESAEELLREIADLSACMQSKLLNFSGQAPPIVNDSLMEVSQVSAKVDAAVGDFAGNVEAAQGSVDAVVDKGQVLLDGSRALVAQLRDLAALLPEDQAAEVVAVADALDERNTRAEQGLAGLRQISTDADALVQNAAQASSALDNAVQQTTLVARAFSSTLFGTTIPALSQSLQQLSSSATLLAAALSSQQTLVDQTQIVLDELDSVVTTSGDALGQTDGLLGTLQQTLANVQTDVLALGQSSVLADVLGESSLDAGKISSFMASPTQVVTEQLYDLNAYGSAMAPLFMNLTFWIGAFMLVVIMKQEVDAEGIRNLTLAQRYVGRFLLFAGMAILQAVICCAGLLVIGVQAVNVPALFFAAAIASLAYLSIIYALSVTLQHIGKGICIVLVFAQIPGATGLYPIEMTPAFFQAVYPFFPFTYGIGAMREAICGLYGTQYLHDVGILLVFFAVAMALGILVRPLMANVNRMVAVQVRRSGLYNGESVDIPAKRYRITQIVRALSDRDEYREELQVRYDRFKRWYPRLIRGAIVVGVVVPCALALVFALTPTEKVVILTVWLVGLVALFVFLAVVETLRFNLERQMQLGGMSDEGLRALYAKRNDVDASDDGESATDGGEGDA